MPQLPNDEFDLDEAIQVLKGTPATVRSLLENLSAKWLNFQEDSQAWSPLTVLVHFVHNERTNWMPRARVILSQQDRREFPPFRQLPENGPPTEESTGRLLTEFAQLREANLAELRKFDLRMDDFEREGVHPVLGTVTLRQLLATWVAHDLNHLHQIAKTLAKRYREAVGPWRPNLPILDL